MMNFLSKLKKFVFDKSYRFCILANMHVYDGLSDKEYLVRKYKAIIGSELRLDHPQTFNEKLQWLKLNDRNPQYTVMVDKLLARQYVEQRNGEQYLIPLVGVWDLPKEIDFNSLPSKFVLKCNHNSGLGMCICKDKSALSSKDISTIRKNLKKGLYQNYYLTGREWPYKNIPRKIIAEEYIETPNHDLPDYKFHCFNGKVKLILVCQNRFGQDGVTEDFFDENWNHLPVKRPNIPTAKSKIERPAKLEEMIRISEKLAKDIPFVRVDLYYVENKIYFGELTFFPTSGFSKFEPEEWDETFGSYLTLPERRI